MSKSNKEKSEINVTMRDFNKYLKDYNKQQPKDVSEHINKIMTEKNKRFILDNILAFHKLLESIDKHEDEDMKFSILKTFHIALEEQMLPYMLKSMLEKYQSR